MGKSGKMTGVVIDLVDLFMMVGELLLAHEELSDASRFLDHQADDVERLADRFRGGPVDMKATERDLRDKAHMLRHDVLHEPDGSEDGSPFQSFSSLERALDTLARYVKDAGKEQELAAYLRREFDLEILEPEDASPGKTEKKHLRPRLTIVRSEDDGSDTPKTP